MARYEIIVFGLILFVLGFSLFISPIISTEITETWSQSVQQGLVSISEQTVKADGYVSQKVNIDIQGKDDYIVTGHVAEITGSGIIFMIFDENNFQSWVKGEASVPVVSFPNIQSKDFSFIPEKSGDYEFVLDNRNSPMEKTVNLSATAFWKETRTETTVPWMGFGPKMQTGLALSVGPTLMIPGLLFLVLGWLTPPKQRRRT